MLFPFSSVFELFLRLFFMTCPVQHNPYNTEEEKFSLAELINILLKRDFFYYTVHVVLCDCPTLFLNWRAARLFSSPAQEALHSVLCRVSTKLQKKHFHETEITISLW